MEEDSNNYEPFESFGLEVDADSNADNSSHSNEDKEDDPIPKMN